MTYEKTKYVSIMLRSLDNPDNNIISVECNLYDMSAYVDMLKRLYDSDRRTYLIIEPVYRPSLLF